jgi:ABC-type sugar transport system ATPase subunit
LDEIQCHALTKAYGGVRALSGVDLSIHAGERLVVLGASGSGKTTLLRLIAGLETPDRGEVRIGGRDVTRLPAHRRDVAMVFQHPALYPHLSVFDNIAFGLRARGVPRNQVRARVNTVAGLLRLDALLLRRPSQLSGGEKQRVAIGRAVARQPRVLLFDEPFSSLDAPLRASLREEVVEVHRQLETTLVLVTHDPSEAMLMGDHLAVLDRGRLLQHGRPLEVYERPSHRSVASFLGIPPINIVPCELYREGDDVRVQPIAAERSHGWLMPAKFGPRNWPEGGQVELGVRPEAVRFHHEGSPLGEGSSPALEVQLRRFDFNGPEMLATLALGPHKLVARWPTGIRAHERMRLRVTLDLTRASWFEPAGGRALERA